MLIEMVSVATSSMLIEQPLIRQTISSDVAKSHEGNPIDVFADPCRNGPLNSWQQRFINPSLHQIQVKFSAQTLPYCDGIRSGDHRQDPGWGQSHDRRYP